MEVIPPFNAFITFYNFMMKYYKKLWDEILRSAETSKEKFFIKIPHQETFPKPVISGSTTLDKNVISAEVKDMTKMLKIYTPSGEKLKEFWERAMSAYK